MSSGIAYLNPHHVAMPVFKNFEIKAIRLMAQSALPDDLLDRVLGAESADSYRYTGCGYFLTVKNAELPVERRSLSDPPVTGVSGEIQAGFIVYLGDNELTLECHTWGAVDVPSDFRDHDVQVQTPPVNYVDLRGQF
jgi:hypothetical protein